MKYNDLNFDLKQLRSFLEVLKEKSLTKASLNLKIGQATISHHLNNLEKNLGVTLIERTSQNFIITTEGKVFEKFCQKFFQKIEDLKKEISKENLEKNIKIGASTIPSAYILPNLIAKIKSSEPKINLKIETSDSREVVEMIKEGKIEIGLVGKKIQHPSLIYEQIYKDKIVLIGSIDSPEKISLNELKKFPFINREYGSGTRTAYEAALKKKKISLSNLNLIHEATTSESVKESVMAGLGIAFISNLAIKNELALNKIKIIKNPIPLIVRSFFVVYSKNKKLNNSVRFFLKELKALKQV